MLKSHAACYRDVLERLSHRLAYVLGEAERYMEQHGMVHDDRLYNGQEEAGNVAEDAAAFCPQPAPCAKWPSLRIQQRVAALRAYLNKRGDLWERVQKVDALMRRLETECLISLKNTTSPDIFNTNGDVHAGRSSTHILTDSTFNTNDVFSTERDTAVRRLVWLRNQLPRQRDEVRKLCQRSSHLYETFQSQFSEVKNVCCNIFGATSNNVDANKSSKNNLHSKTNGDDNVARLHALCRENEARAMRLQARLRRTLNVYQQLVSRSNMEFCRLELELRAME